MAIRDTRVAVRAPKIAAEQNISPAAGPIRKSPELNQKWHFQ